jgi:hypothetical protein
VRPAIWAGVQVIDRGEALVAVVGMRRVIDRSLKYITLEERQRAARLEARIDQLAAQLVNGTLTGAEAPSPVDYDDMLTLLTEPPTVEQLELMIRSLPGEDHDDAAAFLAVAGGCWKYLQASLPIVVQRGLYGAENLPPSGVALTTFEFLLEVLDDPLCTFDLMAIGALLRSQGAALLSCYPTIHAAIVSSITERMAGDPTGGQVALSVSALTGMPYQDPRVTQALAASDQAQAMKDQAQAAKGRQQQPQDSRMAQMTAPPSTSGPGPR